MDEWLEDVHKLARLKGVRFELTRDQWCEWIVAYWDGVSPEDHVAKWAKPRALRVSPVSA